MAATFHDLPPELKKMIVDWLAAIAPECLPKVRFTSKDLQFPADEYFFRHFFSKIVLFNAKKAIEQFVEMTVHPFIGPSIKTVILSALRVAPDGCDQWVERLPVIERQGCETGITIEDILTEAFVNLKSHENPITIGITDEVGGECFGYKEELWPGEDDGAGRQIAADEVDAFYTITDAARASECEIKGIDLMLYPRIGCPKIERVWGYYSFPYVLSSYVDRHPEYDVRIETEIGLNIPMAYNVVYKKDVGLLSIKNSNSVKMFYTWYLSSWLDKIEVKELSICKNTYFYGPHLQELLVKNVRTIESVEWIDLKLEDQGYWKSALNVLSNMPKLKQFTLQNPSVKYKSRGNDLLRYLLNGDTSSRISFEGDVGTQLARELANYEWFRQQKEFDGFADEEAEEQDDTDSESIDDSDTDNGTMEGGAHNSDEEEESESEEGQGSEDEEDNESEAEGQEVDDSPEGTEAGRKSEDDEVGSEPEVELNKYGIVETSSDYEPDSSHSDG